MDSLRNVVRCCYRHLGQEKLLQESSKDKIKTYSSNFPVNILNTGRIIIVNSLILYSENYLLKCNSQCLK